MAIEDGVVNKSGLVQASSNFQLQKSNRALASSEKNTFNELPDCVIFDSIQQFNRIHTAFDGNFVNDLPDHILVLILSLLNPKEAARTSILSHRWRNLWTFMSKLVFDDLLLLREMQSRKVMKSLKVRRSRFINWVNNTLKFHQGTTVDDFKVCFDVGKRSCKSDIDGWIVFALEKRVQSLHLDFRSTSEYLPCGSYTLTTQFLSNYTINSLKDLHLIAVEVTGEVVEYILYACPTLEVLSVQASVSLVGLKVSGPALKLKNLEILNCRLKYIEISAANLMSFSYLGDIITGAVTNVPHLVEASISGTCAPFLVKNIFQFSGLLSRLETLVLSLVVEIFRRFPKFPKMKNLKHFELILDGYHAESLLFCAKLLNVSPLLHRFTLKFVGLATFQIYRKVKEQVTKQPHRCLKVIEFVGFVGCAADTELLLCLLKKAVTLKKLMIDPCANFCSGERIVCKDPELISKARSRAKQLETRLPPSAELVIL